MAVIPTSVNRYSKGWSRLTFETNAGEDLVSEIPYLAKTLRGTMASSFPRFGKHFVREVPFHRRNVPPASHPVPVYSRADR